MEKIDQIAFQQPILFNQLDSSIIVSDPFKFLQIRLKQLKHPNAPSEGYSKTFTVFYTILFLKIASFEVSYIKNYSTVKYMWILEQVMKNFPLWQKGGKLKKSTFTHNGSSNNIVLQRQHLFVRDHLVPNTAWNPEVSPEQSKRNGLPIW